MHSGPLNGLKIIEFEGIGPAPLAGQLLSDLGADVIKILRKHTKIKKEPILDRNKKTISLDLKNINDKAIVGAMSFVNKDIPFARKWYGTSLK